MTTFDTARAGAEAAIGEIIANARVRQRFPAFLMGQASELFAYAGERPYLKRELEGLLKLGSPDPAVVHRGLLIQLNGVFEGFIKSLVGTHVAKMAEKVERFDHLDGDFRNTYSVQASRALTKLPDGGINGVTYNFAALQAGMGSCFSGASKFHVNAEVFTILMGNCTAERLEKLFKQIGLMEPFGDQFGKHKAVQTWCGEGKARRAAGLAREELDRQVEGRNDLAHGLATRDVVLLDVERSAEFFGALVSAYSDLAERLHS